MLDAVKGTEDILHLFIRSLFIKYFTGAYITHNAAPTQIVWSDIQLCYARGGA